MTQAANWTSYADFYQASPYAAFSQAHRSSRSRLPFHMITVEQTDHAFSDPIVPETIVATPLSATPGNSWNWNLGDGWHRDSTVPGRMLVLPADIASRWEVRGSRELLLLAVPSGTIRQILGPCAPDQLTEAFSPLAECTWEDALLPSLMKRLWQALLDGRATDRLLIDGALTTLVTHLLQRAGTIEQSSRRIALPTWRLNRVLDFVDSNLQHEIDILALAEAAGLSVRHFARAFREEVGETPHRWLMNYRIERAIGLLGKRSMALTEIAESCGFTGQSHFTRVFKQMTGQSPGRWRNSMEMK
jgi:AraC family transcriptional regulator